MHTITTECYFADSPYLFWPSAPLATSEEKNKHLYFVCPLAAAAAAAAAAHLAVNVPAKRRVLKEPFNPLNCLFFGLFVVGVGQLH